MSGVSARWLVLGSGFIPEHVLYCIVLHPYTMLTAGHVVVLHWGTFQNIGRLWQANVANHFLHGIYS
jgi:hypothetical protein